MHISRSATLSTLSASPGFEGTPSLAHTQIQCAHISQHTTHTCNHTHTHTCRSATLSTLSASPGFEGTPFGSVVEFAVDGEVRGG